MKRACLIALMLGCVPFAQACAAREVAVHGYLDCRLVDAARARSWTDGGLGKTRYGGDDRSLKCDQAGVVATAQVTPALLALADLQYQTSGRDTLSALEAYVRYRPVSTTPLRWSLKLGAFFPPVSLENDAIGWTSPWTLTPSAINSWIGEELRSIGAETRIEWRGSAQSLEGIAAIVRNNDPAGELLAARGWSLSDLTSGLGSHVREPDAYAVENQEPVPLRFNPFVENDGRLGWYAGANWRVQGRGRIALLRYDNEADPTSHSGGAAPTFSWHTRFWSLGGESDLGDVVLLGQAMSGATTIAPTANFRSTTEFRAAYVLAAWNRGAWRPALRFDSFSTLQQPRDLAYPEREHGNALTIALNWRPCAWLRLTGEALRVRSWRSQRVEAGPASARTDTQLQLGARLEF